MCRFVAYLGRPIPINNVIAKPQYSLIQQSQHAKESIVTLNGDGFGIAWYQPDVHPEPALFRSILPAWNDDNLKNISDQIASPCFLGHVRAAEEGGISHQNCHPFRHGQWTLMHNGRIVGFTQIKLALYQLIAPQYFSAIKGQTDSETLFALWLTYYQDAPQTAQGMMDAWRQVFEQVENAQDQHGLKGRTFINIVVSNGQCLLASRYSRIDEHLSLYYSAGDAFVLMEDQQFHMQPAHPAVHAALVASEKNTSAVDEWHEAPKAHFVWIEPECPPELFAI